MGSTPESSERMRRSTVRHTRQKLAPSFSLYTYFVHFRPALTARKQRLVRNESSAICSHYLTRSQPARVDVRERNRAYLTVSHACPKSRREWTKRPTKACACAMCHGCSHQLQSGKIAVNAATCATQIDDCTCSSKPEEICECSKLEVSDRTLDSR